MRFLIIDDESPSRNELEYLISQYLPEAEIHQAETGHAAVDMVEKTPYDAAFIDIHLGDILGTALPDLLRKKQPGIKIIFATAYDTYATEGFDLNATDYIMKPFQPKRVEMCLQKIQTPTKKKGMDSKRTALRKLAVQKDKKTIILDLDEIAYIESRGRHCMIHSKRGEYLSNDTLSLFEKRLAKSQFFRIHKSFLVNLHYVTELIPWMNGAFSVKLAGFEERHLPVSRNQVKPFKDLFLI